MVGPWSGDGGKVWPFSFSEKCPPQTRSFRRPYVKRQKGNCYSRSREEAPGPGLGCRTRRLQKAQSENSHWAQWEIHRSGMSRPVFHRSILWLVWGQRSEFKGSSSEGWPGGEPRWKQGGLQRKGKLRAPPCGGITWGW